MQLLVAVIVGLLITACGQNASPPVWPARVADVTNFSSENEKELIDSIHSLNAQAPQPIVELEGHGYPLYFVLVEPHENSTKAGYATVDRYQCVIELSSVLFAKSRHDYLESVVWHEIGHCAGLMHDKAGGKIMSAISSPLSDYSASELADFMNRLSGVISK